jgi:hypothetical protein
MQGISGEALVRLLRSAYNAADDRIRPARRAKILPGKFDVKKQSVFCMGIAYHNKLLFLEKIISLYA